MPVSPDEFLILTVASGLSFLFTSLIVYLWCFPCPCRPKCPSLKRTKRKLSSEGKHETLKINNNCNCLGCAQTFAQPLPSTPRSPVIKGPQGHGFYTSGPWKIDSLQDTLTMQLSQPNFLMGEYFSVNSSAMDPSAPPTVHDESQQPPENYFHGHLMNNIMLANNSSPAYWSGHSTYGNEDSGVSNAQTITTMGSSSSLTDMDAHYHETDADMMMVFM